MNIKSLLLMSFVFISTIMPVLSTDKDTVDTKVASYIQGFINSVNNNWWQGILRKSDEECKKFIKETLESDAEKKRLYELLEATEDADQEALQKAVNRYRWEITLRFKYKEFEDSSDLEKETFYVACKLIQEVIKKESRFTITLPSNVKNSLDFQRKRAINRLFTRVTDPASSVDDEIDGFAETIKWEYDKKQLVSGAKEEEVVYDEELVNDIVSFVTYNDDKDDVQKYLKNAVRTLPTHWGPVFFHTTKEADKNDLLKKIYIMNKLYLLLVAKHMDISTMGAQIFPGGTYRKFHDNEENDGFRKAITGFFKYIERKLNEKKTEGEDEIELPQDPPVSTEPVDKGPGDDGGTGPDDDGSRKPADSSPLKTYGPYGVVGLGALGIYALWSKGVFDTILYKHMKMGLPKSYVDKIAARIFALDEAQRAQAIQDLYNNLSVDNVELVKNELRKNGVDV